MIEKEKDVRATVHMQAIWMLVPLFILNIADFFTTLEIINLGGAEANPILQYLIDITGTVWSILWAKVIVLGGLSWLLIQTPTEKFSSFATLIGIKHSLLIINVLYLAVVMRSVDMLITLA